MNPGHTALRSDVPAKLCIALGVILRVGLALVNREANDDHIDVILRIMAGGPQPTILACNECFQPKLYHVLCARLADMLGAATRDQIILTAQFVNVALGALTLLVGYRVVRRLSPDPLVRFLATSWLALNPALLGINVQATNDTLVIFVGTVLIASLIVALADQSSARWTLLVAILAAGTAPHIKGNGIVLALAALPAIAIVVCRRSSSGRFVPSAAAMVAVLLIALLGARVNKSYQHNYRSTGRLLAINMQPAPAPSFLAQSVVYRPGVTSVATAFLTFRIFDLLKVPYVPEAAAPYPLHKTSLWSQLFARTYVLHFEQWPPSWKSQARAVLTLDRMLLVLGLVPTCILFVGLTRLEWTLQDRTERLVCVLFVGAMLAFSIAYSYRYRDVAVMKVVFVLPAVLAFLRFYLDGLRSVLAYPTLRTIVFSTHTAMLTLWIAEAIFLVARLAQQSA
jgi:hypothetical protein